MCGLVGIAGKLETKDEKTMKAMFLLDYLRGPDSTGFAAIRYDGDIKSAKISDHPLALFDSVRFKMALNGNLSTAFMGHNRAATRGKVTSANAHPFQYEHIVGMHNGTLDGLSQHDLEKELDMKFEVDSEAIIVGIAKLGVEKTMSLISGAWSLVWYDSKADTLNFLRNAERPLYLAYTKTFDRLFWASESVAIDASVKLGGPYELYKDDKDYAFFPTATDTWYSFDVNKLIVGGDKRPKPVVKTVKGKEVVVSTSGNFPQKTTSHGTTTSTAMGVPPSTEASTTNPILGGGTSTTTSTTSRGKKLDTLTLKGSPDDPFAGIILETDFEKMVKWGCSWCTTPINYGEQGLIVFERDEVVLCGECACGSHSNKTTRLTRIYLPTIPNQ